MRLLIITAIVFFSSSLFAQNKFLTKQANLLNKNNDKIAIITKGTKVKILEKYKDKSLVQIKGWSYEDEPNDEIFFKYGVTVTLATRNENSPKRKIYQTKEDDYEEIWIENSIQGFIMNKDLTNNFKSIWNDESAFASQRCSGCHEIPAPSSHFAGEFPSLINSMAEQAGLSPKEEKTLVNYFQKKNIYGKK
ncbi:hypothetical protein [Malaciobacter marinus]|uniref:Molybdopterin-containing oxidoreductase II, DMSO/TMAO/BSO reductase family, monoheme c-type cytochrome n=1 Tax=Malaciobacter marinus TaxID=505249 RepID=A0A347TLE8_9BACT|nr:MULTISPECIES: hypothetical protein [Malaciobacter]AXX87426.1 molybdopterin-containing oxidoreductase II, DMSO/TMAO/BSO reductase family, monoheme c-type cytochrome [Malaciobacter marinus]PHO16234.1 hypothetical protein CPH92_02725 [Malaciobacter marinus]RYA22313.1 hypothetical protein CRU96_13780 [Malaciobacter halophilus]